MQSEKVLQGALECLAGKRNMMIIVVAHRLATIQKADTIFIFGECDRVDRGSWIVEQGTRSCCGGGGFIGRWLGCFLF